MTTLVTFWFASARWRRQTLFLLKLSPSGMVTSSGPSTCNSRSRHRAPIPCLHVAYTYYCGSFYGQADPPCAGLGNGEGLGNVETRQLVVVYWLVNRCHFLIKRTPFMIEKSDTISAWLTFCDGPHGLSIVKTPTQVGEMIEPRGCQLETPRISFLSSA
ncbi:hypothetical protein EDB80DRAFT_723450 [Ilyonectria destructans]|nr:hypothetical protein EDB80DRAFT_723450 [Ilyonectria destructans]